MTQTPTAVRGETPPAEWHLLEAAAVAVALGTDARSGLSDAEAARRLREHGPNLLTEDAKPSVVAVALSQVRDPMNLMLILVGVISIVIQQATTAWVVAALVVLNVVLGANQELKARASVAALADLQVPQAKVVRAGKLQMIAAAELVAGDLVAVEAGDLVPADGRLATAASLEAQEAALTGESAPVPKAATPVSGGNVALGDRADMLYQNTSVTRGSGTMIVTATGMDTEVGRIATMLTTVQRTRSPLQGQLDDLTRKLGMVAWGTLAVILVVGLIRGMSFAELMFLGVAMAVSAIPTGLPTFVQSMLAMGAQQLAKAQAIVRNLTDVETLGATSHINTDKTGTLTLNQMTARAVYHAGSWYEVDGEGYASVGAIRGVAGAPAADFEGLAFVCALASDATVNRRGEIVGDPTEAALVVLAEKLGVSVGETRRCYPRIATVPFDSDYKFMATFHVLPFRGAESVVALVKGGPDVILDRCAVALGPDGQPVPITQARREIDIANARLGGQGLRVMAVAVRPMPLSAQPDVALDPMGAVRDLVFLGLVGIIDPLRPEAIEAVRVAHRAGITVRMITGDHLVTAEAIGAELGLPPGGMTGAEFSASSDAELHDRIPETQVFGRVSPEDKMRLVQLLQADGSVVAMTGDAVNDAAALKQADIGVAMGSGSEVSKQAAKMILTDDNFATLVHAVELGRGIFSRITAYIGYQLTQLFGLVTMFLLATAFNVNSGVALLPLQVLFLNFTLAVIPVVVISLDDVEPGLMDRPPRDPREKIFGRQNAVWWIVLGVWWGVLALLPVAFGPDAPSADHATASVTMGFAVMALSTAFAGFVMRKPAASAFTGALVMPALLTVAGVVITVLATELGPLQRLLLTTGLTMGQWLVVLGLSLSFAAVVELGKAVRRRRGEARAAAPLP